MDKTNTHAYLKVGVRSASHHQILSKQLKLPQMLTYMYKMPVKTCFSQSAIFDKY